MSSVGAPFIFSSIDGLNLVREVASESDLPYIPHDYQLEGVCKVLDGLDLVAVLPTGAGKTGYYALYMLMLLRLSKDRDLRGHRHIIKTPADPCLVMVYPTNGLEEEQAETFERAGIKTLIINAETTSRARRKGVNLWVTARDTISIILLSPEQLASPGFESLLQHRDFQTRLCGLGIDEIHLLDSWGRQFRQAFRQVGFARARMPTQTRLLGTTATLLAGAPQDTVMRFLGLRDGEFHFIRRSNLRRNVKMVFRTLTRGLGGWIFPDLKWILASGRKTVIHCRTIVLSFRVALYLWGLCYASGSEPTRRIRLYNALNWSSYNTDTRRLMRDNTEMQIIIATSTFMVGIDLPNIADVVILGSLATADEYVQWAGRAGRNSDLVNNARCLMYVMPKTLQLARAICDGKDARAGKTAGGKKSGAVQMELSMARLLCAPCVSAELNDLYDNPLSDVPCTCPTCPQQSTSSPPTLLAICDCSGSLCMPEDTPVLLVSKQKAPNPVPQRKRLTRVMRAEATKQLRELRDLIYHDPSTACTRSFPPEVFLPDTVIKQLLDRFALIDGKDTLRMEIQTRSHLLPHIDSLWDKIQTLADTFEAMRKEKEQAKRAKPGRRGKDIGIGSEARDVEMLGVPGPSMVPAVSRSVENTVEDTGVCSKSPADSADAIPVTVTSSRFTFQVEWQVPHTSEQTATLSRAVVSSPSPSSMVHASGTFSQWNLNNPEHTTHTPAGIASASMSTSRKRSHAESAGSASVSESIVPRTRARTSRKENRDRTD